MDKRQLTEIITDSFRSLTPSKVSVFVKNEDLISVRVVAESFLGMTFSSRFKMLNQLLKDLAPQVFDSHLFVFEAFTKEEVEKLPASHGEREPDQLDGLKELARPLEP
jgi:stress-induced morphogen